MVNCFAPGCNTNYRSTLKNNKLSGKKNPSTFQAPKDPKLLELWQRAIPRKDKVLSPKDRLCELHFDEECIIRSYESKLTDGSTFKMERGRCTLKPGAVPSIFPNVPSYLSSQKKKRKAPTVRNVDKRLHLDDAFLETESSSQSGFKTLSDNLNEVKVPDLSWTVFFHQGYIMCASWKNLCTERRVIVFENFSIKIFLRDIEILNRTDMPVEVENAESLSLLLHKVNNMVICNGVESKLVVDCGGYVEQADIHVNNLRCQACTKYLKQKKLEVKREKAKISTTIKLRTALQKKRNALRRNARLLKRVVQLKAKIEKYRKKCAVTNEKVLSDTLKTLPLQQQESIKMCILAARVKNKKSLRYSTQWVYECLLLRIKSKKTYEHLRRHKILVLPSLTTINRYLRSVKGIFGFQESTFNCLKEKARFMDDVNRRGVVLLDEMKLTSAITFDKKTMEIQGFVDLGDCTPKEEKNQLGDHALVFMYQPFRGTWIQSLGCFLSKGAASGTILHKLLIECITLMEKSNFYVDAVVCDGAKWNRNMWTQFGVSENNISCEHVSDSKRKLWFFSDFPHLIKNVRNCISQNKQLMTHLGLIDTKYWEAVLEVDNPKGLNLKACPKLRMDVIYPQYYQKMNVAMAFQFFGKSIIAAMTMYSDMHPALENSQPCISILKKFNAAIEAMNGRTPCNGLKLNSPGVEAIKDLLTFVTEWEKFAKEKNFTCVSETTMYGLRITLKATLEILKFLVDECKYEYLMTARLNQDSLERFFGMMRNACGSNDHPDPQQFIQLYRLLSTYSLIKPPKGSCVEGGEILSSLLKISDFKKEDITEKKKRFSELLDEIIDKGMGPDVVTEAIINYNDHDYCAVTSSEFITTYVSGYVVRRMLRFTKCETCKGAMIMEKNSNPDYQLINLKNKGNLIYPSNHLVNLIEFLETSILKSVQNNDLTSNLFLNVMEDLNAGSCIPTVGCPEHKSYLTEKIVSFFITTRFYFLCKQLSKSDAHVKKTTKKYRKLAKL